jgi:hypothetical protein
VFDQPFYGSVFPARVPALEYDEDLVAVLDDMPLQLDQLDLKLSQRPLVSRASCPAWLLCLPFGMAVVAHHI